MVQDFLVSRGLDIKDNRIPQLVSVDTEEGGLAVKPKNFVVLQMTQAGPIKLDPAKSSKSQNSNDLSGSLQGIKTMNTTLQAVQNIYYSVLRSRVKLQQKYGATPRKANSVWYEIERASTSSQPLGRVD